LPTSRNSIPRKVSNIVIRSLQKQIKILELEIVYLKKFPAKEGKGNTVIFYNKKSILKLETVYLQKLPARHSKDIVIYNISEVSSSTSRFKIL
jgi:hypothetical protein